MGHFTTLLLSIAGSIWSYLAVKIRWLLVKSEAFFCWPVPHYTRWGMYLQAAIVLSCFVCWKVFVVLPGASVTVLGFLAVVMTVRAERFTHAERVLWVIVGFAAMLMEINVLYEDRNSHDAEQLAETRRQQVRFEQTLTGFRQLTKQNEAVFAKTKEAATEARSAVDAITGGQSYFYFVLVGADTGGVVTSKGSTSVRSATMRIADSYDLRDVMVGLIRQSSQDGDESTRRLAKIYTDVPLGDLSPNTFRSFPLPHVRVHENEERFSITMTALNGFYVESFVRKFSKGRWTQANRVVRQGKAGGQDRVLLELVDQDFPRDTKGKVDWELPYPPDVLAKLPK